MPGYQLRQFLLFIALLFFAPIQAQKKADILSRKYAPETLQSDLLLFKKVVLAMHPSVGIYHDSTYYSSLFDRAIRDVQDSMSEKTFRIYCKQLVEELHCGHTEVMGSRLYNKSIAKAKLNYSPYVFLPVQDKLYVIANLNKKQDSLLPKGIEVKSLNAISSDSLLRFCRRFISTDGYNQTSKYHFVQLGFNNLYPSLFGRPDSIVIEYKDGKNIKEHRYSAFKVKNIPPLPLKKNEDSLFTVRKKAGIRYREVTGAKKLFVLKLDKFSHTSYKKVYKKVFKQLEKEPADALVLDLRNNGGGSLGNAYRLLSYFIDSNYTQTLYTRIKNYPEQKHTRGNLSFRFTRYVFSIIGKKTSKLNTDYYKYTLRISKKHHYNGKLFVLMNGGSFSASCLVGAYLKGRARTVFIGEESGGTAEGCNAGVTPYYKLPATGIRIRIPAFRLTHDINPTFTGHGLIPDYPVVYSFKDLITRKDLELKKVMELINSSQ
jgi:hypothetical protein